jgi:hypothetical protein
MSSSSHTAPRCRHIKVNGTQCGSPALRSKNFCFYHQQDRPWRVECYSEGEYATGEIPLPYFEDAHSVQSVIRQVVQMVLQKRIERKTASLLLYALQIASSNLKRMELEKPQPEQLVTDVEIESKSEAPIAVIVADAVASDSSVENQSLEPSHEDKDDENLPLGTIQACYQPNPQSLNRPTRDRGPRSGGRIRPPALGNSIFLQQRYNDGSCYGEG